MAKLTMVAVLLVALLAFTEASFRATTTTTIIEEEPTTNQQQSRCQSQLQRYRFRGCQMHLSRGGPYVDEEEGVLENQQQQQYLRQCCQELQNVDPQCQCEAIRYVVRQQQGGGPYGSKGSHQQVLQKAQYLPRQCNLRVQSCQIQAAVV